jgi:hypothetical protein
MIMKNKSKWIGLVWVLCGLRLMAQDTVDEGVRQLIRESLPRVTEAVRAANAGSDRPVTLMPPGVLVTKGAKVSAVEAYMESLLKTALTEAGMTMAEPVEQSIWQNAVATIEVQERKGDLRVGVLDPAYLNTFGKLKLAQRLMTYEVVDVQSTSNRVMVEFTLHLYDLETNVHIWGQTFVEREYLRENVQGLVDLSGEAREVLKEAMAGVKDSLMASDRAKSVESVVILPLSGDVDMYITQLARDAVSQAGLLPRELPLQTEDEARALLRNTPEQVNAALVGAVRDLYREELPDTLEEERFKIRAEVQLALLKAGTLDVLWSDTLSVDQEFSKALPPVEMQLLDVVKANPMYVVYALGGLVALIVLLKMIMAGQRVR